MLAPFDSRSRERFLGVDAGPFRLALPLPTVRQILDLGGGDAPLDARALGVLPHSLARLLGAEPTSQKPAMLLFDGHLGPVVLTCCRMRGVFDAAPPAPLPATVACRWPGLLRGTVEAPGDGTALSMALVLDARVLMGLVEADDSVEVSVL